MTENFTQKKCVPCEGGIPPLREEEVQRHLKNLPGWSLTAGKKSIQACYDMKNFMAAVDLIREIAKIAEAENHHPDLHLTGYRNLRVELSTHAAGGITENDFILAAKINVLPKRLRAPKK